MTHVRQPQRAFACRPMWRTRLGRLLGVCLCLASSSCSKTSRTPLMETLSPRDLSSQELRARLYNAVDRHNRLVSNNADLIALSSDDPVHHENAIRWKMYATSQMLTAAFRIDPLLGMIDSWAFTIQMRQAFETGPLSDYFGAHTRIALEAYEAAEEIFAGMVREMLVDPETTRGNVEAFARDHPLVSLRDGRFTILDAVADGPANQYRTSAFGVGEMQGTMEDLNARAPLLLDNGIKQALWRAELLLEDQGISESVRTMSVELAGINETTNRLAATLDSAVVLLDQVDTLMAGVGSEFTGLVTEINRQRLETLETLTAERVEVLRAINARFDVVLAAVTAERIAVLESVDAMVAATVDESLSGLTEVVDHVFWRLLQLLLVFAALALVVGLLLRRRRPAPTGP